MGYQDDFEDEAPHVHHKSHFDTERCPPPTFGEAAALAEMAKPFTPDLSPQERLQLCADSLREVRSVAAGVTEVRKSTREELATSAEQWITALREHMVDWNCYNRAAEGMVARLDSALKELAES